MWSSALVLPLACVVDPDNRCGENQRIWGNEVRCVCAEGYAYTAGGCVPCGEHAVASMSGCICEEGYARPAPGATCQPIGNNEATAGHGGEQPSNAGQSGEGPGGAAGASAAGNDAGQGVAGADDTDGDAGASGAGPGAPPPLPDGLGDPCDEDAACEVEPFSHCEPTDDDAGYCTSTGCEVPADCEGGYACDTAVSPSICRRPPLGLGKACTGPADCEGTEATYCDLAFSHTCMVQGCTLDPDDCFVGSECCDLSAYGVVEPLCVPSGTCVSP